MHAGPNVDLHLCTTKKVSPEELERAIGIIEELSIVDRVPPHVFIQCGVSPGTLYHAFNHLGLELPDDLW